MESFQYWLVSGLQNSPCLLEKSAICVQLVFLGCSFVQFLCKQLAQSCQPYKIAEAEAEISSYDESSFTTTNFSLLYKATFWCSVLQVGTHSLTLILLALTGCVGMCLSSRTLLAAVTTELIAWIVSTVILAKISKRKASKLSALLRAWWTVNFIHSLIRTLFSIFTVITRQYFPTLLECASFLNFLLCTWFLIVVVKGSAITGFISIEILNPLLGSHEENQNEGQRQCLYANANLLQFVTFSWLSPLFDLGSKKPLEQDDVPDIDAKDSAEFLCHSFGERLNFIKDGSRKYSLYRVMFLFVGKKATINAVFAIVSAGASYVGPYLINDFLKFLCKKDRSLESGYILALTFFGAKMIETMAQRQWIFRARLLGLHLRAALISHIYRKGLYLSNEAKQSHTIGEIVNYMSVDIQRITDVLWYLNIIWMLPVQISLAIYILHVNLGRGSLVSLLATATVMACNIPITQIQRRFQSRIMDSKDQRMKATTEFLKNIKTLKLQAWDTKFHQKLKILRRHEYKWLWNSLRLSAISSFIFWGAPTYISIATFGACLLMGTPLTAGRVLSALATFRMLQEPIFSLPDLLVVLAQAKVSIDRVSAYLQEDEIQNDAVTFVPRSEMVYHVEINNGKFSWDPQSGTSTLEGIELRVLRGKKVAVCGAVGSGKSSLLSCILGEMPKIRGVVKISGTRAYVSQSPWILTGNVRDNILFGNAFDSIKYGKIVQACALKKDLELFAYGDLTEIGERGINMSGGQKQRLQLARALYQDADIYLLDDPFSAVDAHTGSHLFRECLMDILKDKTVLYVTHQVEFLPAADLVLVMRDGKIAQAGSYGDILQQKTGIEVLVGAHSQALDLLISPKNPCQIYNNELKISIEADKVAGNQLVDVPRDPSERNFNPLSMNKRGQFIQDEEREKGSIGKATYWAYLTAVKGGVLIPVILLAQISFQLLQVASNYWMAWASPLTVGTDPAAGTSILFLVYIILSVGSSICVLVRAMLVATVGLLTSEKLFMDMLQSVLHAPMSFFDSTPAGRILNRASTDQSVLDLEMANRLGWCAFATIQLLGSVAVMCQVAWQVFLIFIPVTAICIWYQQYYIPTARELARLTGIQRAPILHHFAESLYGAATIRAFGHEGRFLSLNFALVDNHTRPWFHNMAAMEWLSFRLNVLSNFVFAFSLVVLMSFPEGLINPSIAGLTVTYGLTLNVLQATVIWSICNAENKMISVERILQYSRITSEAPLTVEDSGLPSKWPSIGTIYFRNLQVRYGEHLPLVLKNINCVFPGKSKIGVVGRTGSGKSTLAQVIFRVVEPTEGTIMIDDVDICKIGLHDLRSRLSIIPQDPAMFSATVRGNLDPLHEYSDHEIWEALGKCQLANVVRQKERKLDAAVVENGENWSVGQRQLFCLGRVLLKRSNILILDEATASVDTATDAIIQQIIRQEFGGRTVVTIAHRIHTVMDSDLVLVLNEGKIEEYDMPSQLLEKGDSSFFKLVEEYSRRSQHFNVVTHP